MAGSPCPIEVMKRCVAEMHMREVTIAYGMTETSPVIDQTSHDDPLERRVSTVGRVQPHLEVKIVDTDGRIVPPDTPGEFCTRGYSVMLGYWDDDERTAEAIDRAGWMHTGDLATIDEDGYCNIVGRIKDMVIRGGENVYPREVEEFLFRHPEDRGGAGGRRAGLQNTARNCAPGSSSSPAPARAPKTFRASAGARSPTTRFRATSNSSTPSR